MSDKIREAFEKFAATHHELKWYDTDDWDTDAGYGSVVLQLAYEAWNAALAQQPAPAVPNGWKLVPAEPTDEMLVAGQEVWAVGRQGALEDCREAETIYSAMLAAAPAAPVAQDQVALPDGITISKDFFGTVHIKLGDFDFIQIKYDHRYTYNSHQEWVASRIVEAITAPPAARQSDAVAVPCELLREALAWLEVNDAGYPTKELRALLSGGDA